MVSRVLAAAGCVACFCATAAAAQNLHHLDPEDIPPAWKDFKGDPYLYLLVPPDPPEAARGAKLLSPTRPEWDPMEVTVGDKLRLDSFGRWQTDGGSIRPLSKA
jgi:hypothetical protein